jgi:hypothetical protein
MAGGTPRHHGLGVRGGGFAWSAADRGPEVCHVQHPCDPTVARLPRWSTQARCRGSDDAVAYRASIALAAKAAHQHQNPW